MIWDSLLMSLGLYIVVGFITWLCLLLIYKRCATAGLVYDDHAVIREWGIKEGRWFHLLRYSTRGVVTATYALDFLRSKQTNIVDVTAVDTKSLHWTNICIHILCGLLLLWLAVLLGVSFWGSVVGAAFFMVTPLGVNAVANIAGRASLISTVFNLLVLLLIVQGHIILAVPCVILAVLSKQDMVVLPLQVAMVLAITGYPYWWLVLAVPFIVVCLWMELTVKGRELLSPNQVVINPTTGWPPMPGYLSYIRSFVVESCIRWPKWLLGWGYSISPNIEERSWSSFIAACGVLLIGVFSICMWAPLILKLGFLLWLISPWWSYVGKQMPDIILEHRAYASCIGLAIIVGYLSQYLPAPIISAWLVMLAMKTHERAGFWTPSLLFEKAIEDGSAKPMILLNHSSILISQGRLAEGAALIEEVLISAPNVYQAWGNLGTIHAMDRNAPAMLACYRRGAMRCKRMPLAWSILTDAYEAQGHTVRALAACKHWIGLYWDDRGNCNGDPEHEVAQQKFLRLKAKHAIILANKRA